MSLPLRSLRGLRILAVALACVGTGASSLAAQQSSTIPGLQRSGPVIEAGGMSFKVDAPTFAVPADHEFKVVWEINEPDSSRPQAQLTNIARFLNLHVRHGIPESRLHAAAVVHGGGWPALLTDSAYAARFDGRPNPSRELVQELLAHNVQLVLCGQTAGSRGVKAAELLPGVQLALSAMTAMHVFQSNGYTFNPW